MRELEYPFDSSYILKNRLRLKRELQNEKFIRTPVKIAVLGGSTTHDICNCLQLFLLNQGIEPIFYESEYNKYWEEAMFSNEKLKEFQPDIIYVHTTCRNITVAIYSTDTIMDIGLKLEEQYQHFEKMWEKLRKDYQCLVIQNNFERPLLRLYGNKDISDIHGLSNFVFRLNHRFYEFSQRVSWFYIHDIDYLSSVYGLHKWCDLTAWYMYKYAMAIEAIPEFCYSLANIIKSLYGKNKKVLAVDLDNTLWGGAISEEGLSGIELGEESAEGEMFVEIQKYVKMLKEIGVILAINSKNDMDDVKLAFSHPDMKLEMADFSAIKANWMSKDKNIRDVAKNLNVGLDSIVFLDDSPAERMIVREQLPQTVVPELKEPEQYLKIINGAGYFEVTRLTDEDRERAKMYQAIKACNSEKEKYSNYNEFLLSLNMEVSIHRIDEMNIQRIVQLVNKSNQFNLTTKRYTEDDIRRFIRDERFIGLYGRLKDKFGDNGIVSVLIAEKKEKDIHINLFLMSCRVLKRGMEIAMMDELFRLLTLEECERAFGYYCKTKKNAMVEDFYQEMGFSLRSSTDEGCTFEMLVNNYKNKNKTIKVVSV